MGNLNQKVYAISGDVSKAEAITAGVGTEKANEPPKKLKACCACPETKRARDACIIENGEEHCTDLIEAHKTCMRKMGFNI